MNQHAGGTPHQNITIPKKFCVSIIAGTYYEAMMSDYIQQNVTYLHNHNVTQIDIYKVPGAYEIPAMTYRVANYKKKQYNLILTLGLVIRGETDHYTYVCQSTAQGLMDVSIKVFTPIIFGVLTVFDSAQARARIGSGPAASGLQYRQSCTNLSI